MDRTSEELKLELDKFMSEEQKDELQQEGYDALLIEGKERDKNPYVGEPNAFAAWDEGWVKAQEEIDYISKIPIK
jgi:hypothetical protein